MKKVKLVQKTARTAMGVLEDGTQVWFTKTNSSWYDYGIANRNIGDEFQASVAMSNQGRPFIERLNAEKYISEMNIESAIMRNQLLQKQIASI